MLFSHLLDEKTEILASFEPFSGGDLGRESQDSAPAPPMKKHEIRNLIIRLNVL